MTKPLPKPGAKPGPIPRSALAAARMRAGGEVRHPYVIDKGQVYRWVGIYWIKVREAAEDDYLAFPEVRG